MTSYGNVQKAMREPEPDPVEPALKTALGRRLWSLRQQVLRSGAPLLDWEDLEREIAERRGERRD
jgi:hypothetical protein